MRPTVKGEVGEENGRTESLSESVCDLTVVYWNGCRVRGSGPGKIMPLILVPSTISMCSSMSGRPLRGSLPSAGFWSPATIPHRARYVYQ